MWLAVAGLAIDRVLTQRTELLMESFVHMSAFSPRRNAS